MNRPLGDNWAIHRRRMLAETEMFIEWGLRHPEMVDWIPAKPVSEGGFPVQAANWFYATVFGPEGDRN